MLPDPSLEPNHSSSRSQLTLEQQQAIHNSLASPTWPVRRLAREYGVSAQIIVEAAHREQSRRLANAEAEAKVQQAQAQQPQPAQPWADPALDGFWRPRALTLEQQQQIYDTYYELVHPQHQGHVPIDMETSMNQLAREYRVSAKTIQAAIQWEQIRRINPKAGPNKLGQPNQ